MGDGGNSIDVCVSRDTDLGVVWLLTLGDAQRSGPHVEYTSPINSIIKRAISGG